jgi:hypothetical protein
MKFKLFLHIITILYIFLDFVYSNKNKNSGTKFDRAYNACKKDSCSERSNDDACIFQCISNSCFEQVYSSTEYLLEYGEMNYEMKSKFESCSNNFKK